MTTKLPTEGGAKAGTVDQFLDQVARTPAPAPSSGRRGRLIFAMDATASREPSWDRACHLQAEMFSATSALGGLDVQLVFYRGFRECKASRWVSDSRSLAAAMTAVRCLGGHTQVERVLRHTLKQVDKAPVNALVFVGDCFEEDVDAVCAAAGELGVRGVPAFVFQEGHDPVARRVFQQVARLSRGAYSPFDLNSAEQLKRLLGAVAIFAAGGHRALSDYGRRHGDVVRQLTHQVGR